MKTNVLILVVTVLALGLGACAKKSGKSGASRSSRTNAVTQPGVGSTSCQANMFGAIYDNSISGYDFTQRLIAFTGNTDIGYVESQLTARNTGVDMRMTARFNNGQFDAAGSEILIQIYDDKWAQGMGRLDDIRLAGHTGQVRGQGSFIAVYKDQYGTVTLEGARNYSTNMIEGVVYFQNEGEAQAVLGRFAYNACGLVGI